MKPYLYLLLFLVLAQQAIGQTGPCSRKTHFGEAEICLPPVNGYQECYTFPMAKKLADMTELPDNMVLGFYLNEATYAKRDSLGHITFDDYCKVYGTKELMDYKASLKDLNEMNTMLSGNFISKNWDKMEKEIDKIGIEVEVGVPTLIKSYTLHENSFTYVLLARYELKGIPPYTMAMTINGTLIDQRLVWMAYYLKYTGAATIPILEENSNKILEQLIGKN